MKLAQTECGPTSFLSQNSRALLIKLPWLKTAPFGKPVVPDVYWICAASADAEGADETLPRPPLNYYELLNLEQLVII